MRLIAERLDEMVNELLSMKSIILELIKSNSMQIHPCDHINLIYGNRTAESWNALDSATRNIVNTTTFKQRIEKLLGF